MRKKLDDLFEEADSRYSLVNAVAKRARKIAEEYEEKKEPLEDKPVLMVLEELQSGSSKIMKTDELDEYDLEMINRNNYFY